MVQGIQNPPIIIRFMDERKILNKNFISIMIYRNYIVFKIIIIIKMQLNLNKFESYLKTERKNNNSRPKTTLQTTYTRNISTL